jgi:hypothetical protein
VEGCRGVLSSPPSPASAVGKTYGVLDQQHLAEELQNLRNEVLAAKLGPSEALTYVRAAVLQHNTPKPVQQAAAGGSQYAQSGIKPIPLSGWAYVLLSADVLEENETDKLYLSLWATRGGKDRFTSHRACVPCTCSPWTHTRAPARAPSPLNR